MADSAPPSRSYAWLARSASTQPNRFVALTVFLGAPALCWWARTMVLSITAYSLSGIGSQHLENTLPDAHFAPSACDGYGPASNRRTGPANPAMEFLLDSGRGLLPRTADYPSPL